MVARYMRKLEAGGKISIPEEICDREPFLLHKGSPIRQSAEDGCIVLYRPEKEAAIGADQMENRYAVTLRGELLRQLGWLEGERLYCWAREDLIFLERARCEKCKTEVDLVEYRSCDFMCRACIAGTIYAEKERRK